jgi:signal transduction histidine kinase
MLSTLTEMDSMIDATLAFARDETISETRRPTDITSLLQSVVDDMSDAGLPVSMEPAGPVIYECQPVALKRAFTNLLDNAVKYGKSARAAINATPKAIKITIDDEGPGIAEQQLARVFEPFYRVEESRSRETGGVGLGLAIAQSIVQAHGGVLALANRPTGGVRASLSLPL